MIGRGSRVHPGKTDCCVSRDTPILTDRGLVPVQDVRLTDRVWDGVDFCCHDGPYCNDTKEVIEWSGLFITPDHKVLTDNGWQKAETAKAEGWGPVVGGVGGEPIRAADDSNPYDSRTWSKARSRGGLLSVWEKGLAVLLQNITENTPWVRTLYAKVRPTLPRVGVAEGSAPKAAVSVPAKPCLLSLRRAWHRVSVCLNLRGSVLDRKTPRTTEEQVVDHRPHRQRRALRTRQPQVGNMEHAITQSGVRVAGSAAPDVSIRDVLRHTSVAAQKEGTDPEADCRPMVAEVWDIRNVGPRHRYCASGLIIANCVIDHGGNLKRNLGLFEDDPKWSLDITTKDPGEVGTRPTIECPKCQAIYRGGLCASCGYEPTSRERRGQGLEFDGAELTEVKPKEKKAPSVKSPEEMMITALYQAGRSGRTWKQCVGIYLRACEKQGTRHRVPKTVTVAGRRYNMIRYGSDDGTRRVGVLYPFVTGGGHGGDHLVPESVSAGTPY